MIATMLIIFFWVVPIAQPWGTFSPKNTWGEIGKSFLNSTLSTNNGPQSGQLTCNVSLQHDFLLGQYTLQWCKNLIEGYRGAQLILYQGGISASKSLFNCLGRQKAETRRPLKKRRKYYGVSWRSDIQSGKFYKIHKQNKVKMNQRICDNNFFHNG